MYPHPQRYASSAPVTASPVTPELVYRDRERYDASPNVGIYDTAGLLPHAQYFLLNKKIIFSIVNTSKSSAINLKILSI
jgi:hypothetical protein